MVIAGFRCCLAGKAFLRDTCETFCFAILSYLLYPISTHTIYIVRLNLFNHVLALFRAKFTCNLAIRYSVFRWDLCKGSVCESVKKTKDVCNSKESRDWISRLASRHNGTRVKHAGELKGHDSWSTTGQNFQCGQAVSSRLRLVTRSSCKVE